MDAYVTFSVEIDVSDDIADELAERWGAQRLPARGASTGRLQWREVARKGPDPNDTEMFERALRGLLLSVEPLKEPLRTTYRMTKSPEIDVVMPVSPDTDSTEEYVRFPSDVLVGLAEWNASVEVYAYDLHRGDRERH